MQKALERMNIKLHDVISSLTGKSGLAVVKAILNGERDPQRLLELCDVQIRKNKAAAVRESLRGTWRTEHLFALRQALAAWEFYQGQIAECDRAIEELLNEWAGPGDPPETASGHSKHKAGPNTPQIEGLHRILVKLCAGRDPTHIPALTDYALLQRISGGGTDLSKWPTAKHFTSWTGLAPGTKQSGKRRGSFSRRRNRAGQIFSTLAMSLGRSVDKALGGFYRRLKARRGGLIANRALARKIAALFWQVMVHGVAYAEEGLKRYEARVLETETRLLRKLARKHGFTLQAAAT
jgi:transposase